MNPPAFALAIMPLSVTSADTSSDGSPPELLRFSIPRLAAKAVDVETVLARHRRAHDSPKGGDSFSFQFVESERTGLHDRHCRIAASPGLATFLLSELDTAAHAAERAHNSIVALVCTMARATVLEALEERRRSRGRTGSATQSARSE